MPLTLVGDLTTKLPLETGQDQPAQRIPHAALEKLGVWMAIRHHQGFDRGLHLLHRALDPHPQDLCPLATVDREAAMRWNPLDMFAVVEIVAVVLRILGDRLAFRLQPLTTELAAFFENRPHALSHVDSRRKLVCDDVPHAEQGVGSRRHLAIRVDKVCRTTVEIGSGGVSSEDLPRERFQPPLASYFGQ